MTVIYTIVATALNADGTVRVTLRSTVDDSTAQMTVAAALAAQAYVGRQVQAVWSFL